MRLVEGNASGEPATAERLHVSVAFKRERAAGQDVGHYASRQRDDIADDAGDRQCEHARRNRRAVAGEIGHQAEQVLRGGRMLLRALRLFRGGWGLSGVVFRALVRVGVPGVWYEG